MNMASSFSILFSKKYDQKNVNSKPEVEKKAKEEVESKSTEDNNNEKVSLLLPIASQPIDIPARKKKTDIVDKSSPNSPYGRYLERKSKRAERFLFSLGKKVPPKTDNQQDDVSHHYRLDLNR